MALLKETKLKNNWVSIYGKIPQHVKKEALKYIKYAKLYSMNDLVHKAIVFVLENDKEWQKFKINRKQRSE